MISESPSLRAERSNPAGATTSDVAPAWVTTLRVMTSDASTEPLNAPSYQVAWITGTASAPSHSVLAGIDSPFITMVRGRSRANSPTFVS